MNWRGILLSLLPRTEIHVPVCMLHTNQLRCFTRLRSRRTSKKKLPLSWGAEHFTWMPTTVWGVWDTHALRQVTRNGKVCWRVDWLAYTLWDYFWIPRSEFSLQASETGTEPKSLCSPQMGIWVGNTHTALSRTWGAAFGGRPGCQLLINEIKSKTTTTICHNKVTDSSIHSRLTSMHALKDRFSEILWWCEWEQPP